MSDLLLYVFIMVLFSLIKRLEHRVVKLEDKIQQRGVMGTSSYAPFQN